MIEHTRGDSFPLGVTGRTRVDVETVAMEIFYGVLADDVDWGFVKHYRVLSSHDTP